MRRTRFAVSALLSVGLAAALAAAGCGGSGAVTGADEVPAAAGNAVIQGTVVGGGFGAAPTGEGDVLASAAGSDMTVRVEGTAVATGVDEEGEFILSNVPAGTVTLLFEGGGTSARLTVSGLVDGQVLSIEVQVSGADAHVTGPPECAPTKYTKVTGTLEEMSDTSLVVSGHPVDASEVGKVWRGDRRIELNQLVVGEKIKVWGTLRGDGVLVAEEIRALTSGPAEWITLEGRITKVKSSSLDVHGSPNGGGGGAGVCSSSLGDPVHASPNTTSCPTFWVGQRKVITEGGTKFTKRGGGKLDPSSIAVGQRAYVEGWLKLGGQVVASKVVIG